MKFLKNSSFIIVFILFHLKFLYAENSMFLWPVEIDKNIISSTFGESRYDHFHAGIDIAGENLSIYPIKDGKLLYLEFQSMNSHVRRFPSGSGNQVWLDHGNGYWSGYFHLKQFFLPDKKIQISSNESLGLTGNTGRSYGAHLHFFILENYGKKIINPLKILSKEIDENPPIIEYLAIIIKEQEKEHITTILPNTNNFIRLTKPRPIFLKVYDPGKIKQSRRFPYRIECLFKNQIKNEQYTFQFDYLETSDKGLLLNGIYKFEDLFYKNFFKLGIFDYTNGINEIIVTAYDYNKNETTERFILNIKKEY